MNQLIVCLIIYTCVVVNADDARFEYSHGLVDNERIYRYKRHGVEKQDCANNIRMNGLSLINEGISKLDSSITYQNRFYDAIEDLYNSLETNKTSIKKKIGEYLGQYSGSARDDLFHYNDFEKSLIYTYTSDHVYTDLNRVLREHDCTYKSLTQKEKLLGPYTAALMAVLIHWNQLGYATGASYRGSVVTEEDVKVYKQSSKIVWLNFASSSTDKSKVGMFTGNAVFYLNNQNSATSRWKPKLICDCSKYKTECEALYPPGAVFGVDKVTNNAGKYMIELTLQGGLTTAGRKRRSVSSDVEANKVFCIKGAISSACSIQIYIWNIFSVFTLAYLNIADL